MNRSADYLRGRYAGLEEIQNYGRLWKVTVKMAQRLVADPSTSVAEREYWQGFLSSGVAA